MQGHPGCCDWTFATRLSCHHFKKSLLLKSYGVHTDSDAPLRGTSIVLKNKKDLENENVLSTETESSTQHYLDGIAWVGL